jgi:exo-1,4-beta-D-glucosaminidase
MPRSEVTASTKISSETKGEGTARITLTNRSNHVAFFLRAEITKGADGEEVLPITYDDNYITLYPHETRTLVATFAISALEGRPAALRVEGYNVAKKISSPNQ